LRTIINNHFCRCKLHDHAPAYTRSQSYSSYTPTTHSPPQSPYARNFATPSAYDDGGPDIIPRFSPTQSRPRSYFNSDPYPQSYAAPSTIPISLEPSKIHINSRSSTALASLRELATTLPKTTRRGEDSPPKSAASSISRTGSGVWNYMPFTAKTTEPTPDSSYSQMGYASQSYGAHSSNAYARKEETSTKGYLYAITPSVGGYGNTGGMGMDRPLPPRSGPGGYGHRPRSIDLVTPFSGAS